MATQAQHAPHAGHTDHVHHPNYVKIYWILLVLLIISFLGPFIGIRWITLLTAFGIAVVKAYLVAKNFMHVNLQPRFVSYILGTVLVFMLLFYAGTAPDVMKAHGDNWQKQPPTHEVISSHHGAH
jgi:caa(3)-type oxidase subunit IV